MATYKSDEVKLNSPAEAVFAKLSNLTGLRELLDRLPADRIPEENRAMFDGLQITSDSITIPGGPVGSITLQMSRLEEPSLIELQGVGTPVPLSLALHIKPLAADSCEARAEINLEIPAMLKPMISGPMQKAVGQFAHVLSALNFQS